MSTEQVREITLLFQGLNLEPGAQLNVSLRVENGQATVEVPPGVSARAINVPPSLPAQVASLAGRLRSTGGLQSTLARIERAYYIGQNIHRCGVGEDNFEAGDIRPDLTSSIWIVHGVAGDFAREPALFYTVAERGEALGPLEVRSVVLGFASQAEGEACLIGAGSSLDSAVRQGRQWRRQRSPS